VTGLVDTCFQRGYAWDDPHVCVYSQLPSGGVPFRYPYAVFNNKLNTGFVGTTLPVQASVNLSLKL